MRLLTRSDFDGLACAVLLTEAGIVDKYKFVHPKDVQDGKVDVTTNDVLANLPYIPGCGYWFDHHASELKRLKLFKQFQYRGKSEVAPSCARVIYDYFGGAKEFSRFDESGMMEAVDRSDSGQLTYDEVVQPTGWILLSFIMDPRTGLGRYKDYRISNYRLMEAMIDYCRTKSVEETLQVPDVQERAKRYFQLEKDYDQMIKKNTFVDDNLLVINLLSAEPLYPGNRFKEFVFFPEQNASIRIIWGFKKQNIVLTCGSSILNRTLTVDIGALMLKYGGGGHPTVGTCQAETGDWERVKNELVAALRGK